MDQRIYFMLCSTTKLGIAKVTNSITRVLQKQLDKEIVYGLATLLTIELYP